MSATGRPPKKEEHAPSLFGWLRSSASKTRDEAEVNPHLGQVNVGVSRPARRGFRLPRALVVWVVVLAALGILAAVIGPTLATFVESFDEAFDNGGGDKGEPFRQKAGRVRERVSTDPSPPSVTKDPAFDELEKMTDCLSAAGGDVDRIVECTSR